MWLLTWTFIVAARLCIPRYLFTQLLARNALILDKNLGVLTLGLSLANLPCYTYPLIAISVLLESPFVELAYVLCFAVGIIRSKNSLQMGNGSLTWDETHSRLLQTQ